MSVLSANKFGCHTIKQRYILLEDVPGVTRGPRGEESVVVSRGTLLHRIAETCNFQVCSLYDLISNHSTTLKYGEDTGIVLSLSKLEAQLLSAIPIPADRYIVYKTPGKIEWGMRLKGGDTVYIHLRDVHCVAATVRYIGHLIEGYGPDRIMFGVEIKDPKYRGWGNSDGTNRRSTKKAERWFTCDKNCGLFLSLDELQEKPGKKVIAYQDEETEEVKQTNSSQVTQTTTDNIHMFGDAADRKEAAKKFRLSQSRRASSKEGSKEQEDRPNTRSTTCTSKEHNDTQLQAMVEDERDGSNEQCDIHQEEIEDFQEPNLKVDGSQTGLYVVDAGQPSINPTVCAIQAQVVVQSVNTSNESPVPPKQQKSALFATEERFPSMGAEYSNKRTDAHAHSRSVAHETLNPPPLPLPAMQGSHTQFFFDSGTVSTTRPTSSTLKLDVPKPIDKEAQQQMAEENLRAESLQLNYRISKLAQVNKQLFNSLKHYPGQDNERLKFERQLRQQREDIDRLKAQVESPYRWWEIPSEEVKIIRVLEQEGWGYIAKGKFHGQKVSIKCLLQEVLSHSTTGQIRHLMSTMAQFQHPNLLPFLGAVFNPESSDSSLLIVSELTDTTLRSAYKDNLLEKHCKLPILSDIASALCCLHSQRQLIVHGGVTSANVLLEGKRNNTWKAKLSDFGSANLLYLGPTASERTTPYSAPEISQGGELTIKLDVYSFGVLVCEVVLCQLPLDPKEFPAMLKEVQASQDQEIYAIAEDCTKQGQSDRPFMSSVSHRINELIDED